jgi:hypothetical protein
MNSKLKERIDHSKYILNLKYIQIYPQWHCHFRTGGGLFVGCRLQFPARIYALNPEGYIWTSLHLTLGLLIFSLNIELKYKHNKKLPQ